MVYCDLSVSKNSLFPGLHPQQWPKDVLNEQIVRIRISFSLHNIDWNFCLYEIIIKSHYENEYTQMCDHSKRDNALHFLW